MTGEQLVRLRVDLGLSADQAARQIGIAGPTLAKAERGGSLHPATAKKIADFYGLRPSDVFFAEGECRA